MQSQVAELKQQGALEAARDPNSRVTAEDAERKMVKETVNAGHRAYQFDPNASPEEKAAQARAVRLSMESRRHGSIRLILVRFSNCHQDFITRRRAMLSA
jgi:hypothetical protein